MSEERGEHSLSVYTYFNPHLLLLLERIILKQTAVTKVCVLFCFLFFFFIFPIELLNICLSAMAVFSLC